MSWDPKSAAFPDWHGGCIPFAPESVMNVFCVSRLEDRPRANRGCELITLEAPQKGRSLTLYHSRSGRRLQTTFVERVLDLADGATYVRTRNSTYRLESLSQMPSDLPRTGNDW